MARRQVGYAVIGLGQIAREAVLPAFGRAAKNSRLVALVSGDAAKQAELGARYGVRTYSYDELDACLDAEDIDAVYIALPNDMHANVAVRAAQAGVHVLCEKPMALSEKDCRRMIDACRTARVKLMVAYRLHFDKANLEALALARQGRLGALKLFDSAFSFQVAEGNIRTQRARGGGPMWDIGIDCVNAARTLLGAEPVEVSALAAPGADPRFAEVDEAIGAVLRFGDGKLATFVCSFGAAHQSSFTLVGTDGWLRLDRAYQYRGKRLRTLHVGEEETRRTFGEVDQFAPELLHFSACVLRDDEPRPSGLEGLADVRVICALHEAVQSGRPVRLAPFESRPAGFEPETAEERPPAPGIPTAPAEPPSHG